MERKLKDLGLSIPKNAMPYIAFPVSSTEFQTEFTDWRRFKRKNK